MWFEKKKFSNHIFSMWLWLKIPHVDFLNKIVYLKNHSPFYPQKTKQKKHLLKVISIAMFQIIWIVEGYKRDHNNLMNKFVPIEKTNKNMENL